MNGKSRGKFMKFLPKNFYDWWNYQSEIFSRLFYKSNELIVIFFIMLFHQWKTLKIFEARSFRDLIRDSYLFVFSDWAEEAVAKAEILRLIYQGRFLHSNVTLGALGLPFGKTTVMHLVPRENLPEPNSQGKSSTIFLFILSRRKMKGTVLARERKVFMFPITNIEPRFNPLMVDSLERA